MANKKLMIATGKYLKNGQQANQYTQIGNLIENEKGTFLAIDMQYLNPSLLYQLGKAGLLQDGKTAVFVSMFDQEYKAAPPKNDFNPDQDVPF